MHKLDKKENVSDWLIILILVIANLRIRFIARLNAFLSSIDHLIIFRLPLGQTHVKKKLHSKQLFENQIE